MICSTGFQILLAAALSLASADAIASSSPQCLDQAKSQALTVLRHHVHDDGIREPASAELDATSPLSTLLRADPRGPEFPRWEVIEIGGFYAKTDYNIKLTYIPAKGSCALVGESIFPSVRLRPPSPLSKSRARCLGDAQADALTLIRFHAGLEEQREWAETDFRVSPPFRLTQQVNPWEHARSRLEVVEMLGYALQTKYRIKLTYVPTLNSCALMGREILKSVSSH